MSTGFSPAEKGYILIRDGGMCAMFGAPGCDGDRADEVNHRLNRKAGGSRLRNGMGNGVSIASLCNGHLESDAEFAEEGRRRGVKLVEGQDPEQVPVWSPFFRQWVLLTDGALDFTGITDPTLDARLAEEWLWETP